MVIQMSETKITYTNKDFRSRKIFSLCLAIIIVLLLLYISNFLHYRIDLTAEKRYSLSKETKKALKEMKDVAYVKVYLDGDLPIGFKKMKNRIRELLDEFKIYAGDNVEYEFINPLKSADTKERDRLLFDLSNKGLHITNIMDRDQEGGTSEKKIVPGAIITFRKSSMPINLLKNNASLSAEQNLNNSIQALEYEFIHVIKSISTQPQKIAFIEGQGELDQYQVDDITTELLSFYNVERLSIDGHADRLDGFDAVIIAKPSKAFSEADKFALDQYLMKGGNLLFFLDEVKASLDSLVDGNTVAMINQLNLDDQLFRYGVRMNPVLLQDAVCATIPINTAPNGSEARFYPAPWLYYPLLQPSNSNPVTRFIQLVKSEFPGTIDTLQTGEPQIKKSVLLSSSEYARKVNAPTIISLEEIKRKPDPADFTLSGVPVGVLLEGRFKSVFQNRILTQMGISGKYSYLPEGKAARLFVVADGDIIRNEVLYNPKGAMKLPLGFDRYSKTTFGNKDFIVNLVTYMTDESGLIKLRSKEFRLRLLDKTKIRTSRLSWQLVNTLIPLILVIICGLIINYSRHRKFASQ
jgi:ABC-2 type transport system permease protein